MIINIQGNVAKSNQLKNEVDEFLNRGGVVISLKQGFSGECTFGWNKSNPNLTLSQKKEMRDAALKEGIERRGRMKLNKSTIDSNRKQLAEQKIIIGSFLSKCLKGDLKRLGDICDMNPYSIKKASTGKVLMYKRNWEKVKHEISVFVYSKPKPKLVAKRDIVKRKRTNNMDLMREAISLGFKTFDGFCNKHGEIEMQINGINKITYKCYKCRKEGRKKVGRVKA